MEHTGWGILEPFDDGGRLTLSTEDRPLALEDGLDIGLDDESLEDGREARAEVGRELQLDPILRGIIDGLIAGL